MLKKHLDELVISKNKIKILEQIAKTAQTSDEKSLQSKNLSLSPRKKINRNDEDLFSLPNIKLNLKFFLLYLYFFTKKNYLVKKLILNQRILGI